MGVVMQQAKEMHMPSHLLLRLQHTIESLGHPLSDFQAYGNAETMKRIAPSRQVLELAGLIFKQTATRRSKHLKFSASRARDSSSSLFCLQAKPWHPFIFARFADDLNMSKAGQLLVKVFAQRMLPLLLCCDPMLPCISETARSALAHCGLYILETSFSM